MTLTMRSIVFTLAELKQLLQRQPDLDDDTGDPLEIEDEIDRKIKFALRYK